MSVHIRHFQNRTEASKQTNQPPLRFTRWFQFTRVPMKSSLRSLSACFFLQPLGGTNFYVIVQYMYMLQTCIGSSLFPTWIAISYHDSQPRALLSREHIRALMGATLKYSRPCKLVLSTCIPAVSLPDSQVKGYLMWQVQAQAIIDCKFGNDNP